MSSEDINEDVNEVDEITEIEDDIINDENSGEEDLEQEELTALEDPAEQKRLIEALLFASPELQTLRTIQGRLPDSADVGRILMELQEDYAQRGVNLVRLEDAWAFRTAPDIGPYLALAKKQEKNSPALRWKHWRSPYHQPVTHAEIENIRVSRPTKGHWMSCWKPDGSNQVAGAKHLAVL